jgi:hypothetical protein
MSFPLPRVAVGTLSTRSSLHSLFGLDTPILLDVVAVGLLAYAGALALLLFWTQLTPMARALVIAVDLVVEVFAILRFRAAKVYISRTPPGRLDRVAPPLLPQQITTGGDSGTSVRKVLLASLRRELPRQGPSKPGPSH